MDQEHGEAALSAPETLNERPESSVAKRRRRSTVRVACNACRSKKTRCDGRRPVCGWCASHPGVQCVYDTERAEETRSGALKRENEILRRNLEYADQFLQDLTSLSREESMEIFNRLRVSGNPLRTSQSNIASPYGEPSSSPGYEFKGGLLPSISSISSSESLPTPDPVQQRSAPLMNPPMSKEIRSYPSPAESSHRTPGFNVLIKRPSTDPLQISGAMQRGAPGTVANALLN